LRSKSPVFPTHVGVNRRRLSQPAAGAGLPHACGGEPVDSLGLVVNYQSSPRMWG